jgi:hypothetical protein
MLRPAFLSAKPKRLLVRFGFGASWASSPSMSVQCPCVSTRMASSGSALPTPFWLNFGAHAVDYQKPSISETGYRSFVGCHADPIPGITPDEFARRMIDAYVKQECKGKLKKIERSYVEREMDRRAAKTNPQQREPDL